MGDQSYYTRPFGSVPERNEWDWFLLYLSTCPHEYSKGDLVSPFWLSVRQMAIAGWSLVGWLIRGGRGTSYGLYRERICIAGHGWKRLKLVPGQMRTAHHGPPRPTCQRTHCVHGGARSIESLGCMEGHGKSTACCPDPSWRFRPNQTSNTASVEVGYTIIFRL